MSASRHPLSAVAQSLVTSVSVPAPAHSARSLVERHGAVSRDAIVVHVGHAGSAAVIEVGKHVSAARLVDDGVRMLGVASDFAAVATPGQRVLIAAIDGPFLAAASGALHHVAEHKSTATRRGITADARKAGAQRTVTKLMASGRAQRDLYAANLTAACGNDAAWRARIAGTVVAVTTPAELAQSIEAMAVEGRALQSHLAAEKRPTFLSEDYLGGMSAYATELRDGGSAATGVIDAAASARGDLAWWQGASVWFLSTVVSVFGRAHAADATVPKITPRQLRALLQPHKMRKKSAKKADAKKAEPAAPAKPAGDG
jgi:hypothetical protein